MELRYILTVEDLAEVQAQILLLRRFRLLDDHKLPAYIGLGLSLVGLPFYLALVPARESGVAWGDRALEFFLSVGFAVLGVYFIAPLLPRRGLRRDRDFAGCLRVAKRVVARSVLGPVTLQVDADALQRINADGESLRVTWADVRRVLVSPTVITLQLRRVSRVLAVPRRAFADAAAADAFRSLVEARAGAPSIDVGFDLPVPPAPPLREWLSRVRLPMLATGLVVSLLLFMQLALLPWLRSPLRTNPAGAVVVYSTAWCPSCARLRLCLERSGIAFDERDIDHSQRAREEWRAVDGRAIPVVLVGQEVVFGAGAELERQLAALGKPLDCSRD